MTEELGASSSTRQPDAVALFNFEGATRPRGRCQPVMERLQRCALHMSRPLSALMGRRPSNAFGILLYHRITSVDSSFSEPTINVTPSRLRSQLSGLLARGYQAWPLGRVLRHRCAGKIVPRNVFVVTFDDGFANNYKQALPILRDLNVPATIFLATAYLDSEQPFPFDGWEGAGASAERQSWQTLTTDQCADMLDGGLIEIGAHTHTHEDFRGRPEAFHADLEQCVDSLYSKFGLDEITFAFPQGRKGTGFAGPDLVSAAREVGVVCALTTENDLVLPTDDPFDLGRFTVEQHDTAGSLAARLDGWYALARDCYRKLRNLGR